MTEYKLHDQVMTPDGRGYIVGSCPAILNPTLLQRLFRCNKKRLLLVYYSRHGRITKGNKESPAIVYAYKPGDIKDGK